VLDQVATHELGDVLGLNGVVPVPVVPAPGVIRQPIWQEHIPQVRNPRLPRLRHDPVGPLDAHRDELVQEAQDEHDCAGLEILPRDILGVGIPAPGWRPWPRIAVLRELDPPARGGLQPTPFARQAVGLHEGVPHLPHDIQLNEAVGIGVTVGLALGWDTDGEPRPGVLLIG